MWIVKGEEEVSPEAYIDYGPPKRFNVEPLIISINIDLGVRFQLFKKLLKLH